TDRQFALGCSPPRLTATQLPSATELWHTPAWTFTMLMWHLHGRTHSRAEAGTPEPLLNLPFCQGGDKQGGDKKGVKEPGRASYRQLARNDD
ncbi:MAG TPA: hypothetical protein VE616_11240, partial [Candidatus Udaeobacter sp.]|nr:hypothetical protein [Candidatus Udaeobacter sp.]